MTESPDWTGCALPGMHCYTHVSIDYTVMTVRL